MGRSARCGIGMLALAASCVLSPSVAAAQWRLDFQAGRLHYEGIPDASTTSAVALSHATPASSVGLSAGVPFGADEPVWGALYGARRFTSAGSLAIGVDAAGNAFAFRIAAPDSTPLLPLPTTGDRAATGWGAALELMPLVAWQRGVWSAEARAGVVAVAAGRSDATSFDRIAQTADATLAVRPVRGLSARLETRWVRVSEGGFPYAGVGFVWTGAVTAWGSVGRWLDDDVEPLAFDAGLAVPLARRMSLSVGAQGAPFDPVYDTPARTSWSVGLGLLLGDAPGIARPVPASYVDGIAVIALDGDRAEGTPSIAGDFNGWTPEPMTADGDDWVHRVRLEPGVYNYAFVDEAGNWFVPEGTPGRRADGMGGWVAVLVVE